MSDNSAQVTELIRELLVLNNVEGSPQHLPPTAQEVEGRQSKRKTIRQTLVKVLHLRDKREEARP
jgi:hypothetical protein